MVISWDFMVISWDFYGDFLGFYGDFMGFTRIYPLVNVYVENSNVFFAGKLTMSMTIFNGHVELPDSRYGEQKLEIILFQDHVMELEFK